MNKEEKEAIEYLKNYRYENEVSKSIDIVLNLIDKLQKENEELKEELEKYKKQIDLEFVEENYIEKSKYDKLQKENEIKDKVIDNLYDDIEYEYGGTCYLKSLDEYYKEVESE